MPPPPGSASVSPLHASVLTVVLSHESHLSTPPRNAVSFGESIVYTSVVSGSANPVYGEKFTMYAPPRTHDLDLPWLTSVSVRRLTAWRAVIRSSEGGRPASLKLKVYTTVKHGAVDFLLGHGTLPVESMQSDYDFTIPLLDGFMVTGKAHLYIQVGASA
jgi:hypothetical protein